MSLETDEQDDGPCSVNNTHKDNTNKFVSIPSNSVINGSDENISFSSLNLGSNHCHYHHELDPYKSCLIEQDADEIDYFIENDEASGKTFSRRLVENTLIKYKWYNPNANNVEVDLRKGWAFYEHYTLRRCISGVTGEETKTSLFSIFGTPACALSKWGIGVGLYFNAIRTMTVTLLIAGLIHIPNLVYFSSEEYHGVNFKPSTMTLWGSAVCEHSKWMTCESYRGNSDAWCDPEKMKRKGIEYATSPNATFVKRSLCDGGTLRTGMTSYSAFLFVLFVTVYYTYYTSKIARKFYEDEPTASTYSIHINNPPDDAYDPSEWRDFFMKYVNSENDIVACTIILDNNELLSNLIKRRVCRYKLRKLLPEVDIDNEVELKLALNDHAEGRSEKWYCLNKLAYATIQPILQYFELSLPAEMLVDKIATYTKKVTALLEKKYKVVDVIITFDKEQDQRDVLKDLRAGSFQVRFQQIKKEDTSKLFRGRVLLEVERPVEPDALRYRDMSTPVTSQILRWITTFTILCGLVALGAYIVYSVRKKQGPLLGGIITSLLNLIIPGIAKLLLLIEKHSAEGKAQRSLYVKILIFRCFNTVIWLRFLDEFYRPLGNGRNDLLRAINGVFFSEMILVPIIRYIDIIGTISKHVLAPRATTRQQMYRHFQGTKYNLGERYTDLAKIVFLSYFYCALFPSTLFFGSLTLFIRYYTDKFCLMRVWQQAPHIGTQITDLSSKYVFTLAVVIGAYISAFDWINFRYDNVCDGQSESIAQGYDGNVTFHNGTNSILHVDTGLGVRVCTSDKCCQEALWNILTLWRLQSEELRWMSKEQTRVAVVYGATAFSLLIGYILLVFGRYSLRLYRALHHRRGYSPKIEVQNENFTSLDIPGYIPQAKVAQFPFPLILCEADCIRPSMVGPRSHLHQNLVSDIPNHSRKFLKDDCIILNATTSTPTFDIVKQWKTTNDDYCDS